MSREQRLDKGDPLFLSSEDRADGFSIVSDNRHNITLLKWSKPVAWFSAVVTKETLTAFLGIVKVYERNATGGKRNQN